VKLRVATCMTLPEVDADEAPLAAALAAAGIDARLVAWDDPEADWEAAIPTIIRSTWNYSLHVDAFLAWIDRASAAAPLLNPPDIVRTNVHKRYLLELQSRGVPTVPTIVVERGQQLDDVARLFDGAEQRVVIKPEVGAGSRDTERFLLPADNAAAKRHLDKLIASGAALVQPYMASVQQYGERSLIWIDGAFTHAIRKNPRFSADAESVSGPFPIAEDERRAATAALEPYVDRICYGRVDLVRDDHDQPRIMELELVEPSLFFPKYPPSLDRFVAGLKRRLSW
jgi:glutathione synthase/RimK-type ligase-like ATP-grasp enzyme